ncbi:MAG: ABC transporter ATP-binding protein [Phycicoccus sp.]
MIRQLVEVLGPQAAAPLRRHVVLLVVYGIAQGICFVLLIPVLRALLADDTGAAARWLAVLAGAVGATAALHWTQAMAGYRVGMSLSRTVHRRIGDHVVKLPLGWFDGPRVGQLSRLASQGVQDVMGVPAHLLAPVVVGVTTPATVLVGLAVIDWPIGEAAAAAVPGMWAAYRLGGWLIGRADGAADAAGAEAAGRLVEFARAQPVLRAFTGARGWAPLDAALVEQRRAGRRMLVSGALGPVAFALALQAGFVAVVVVGVARTLSGDLDPVTLLALLVLAVRFTEPLLLVADLGGGLRMARNSLSRIRDLLGTPTLPEPDEPVIPIDLALPAPTPSAEGTPAIRLRDVTFGYRRGSPVLRDVSLDVPAGHTVALVGASGSGKTTVTRLVARFFDVDAGAVEVGGVDVRRLRTEDLMAQLSLVFQDVYLFSGSIVDNIQMGRPDADDAAVRRAAAAARVDEIVDRLPDGWDTEVGEGGVRLSGGERQRVSIARALLKDAPVVLLDEATATLDPRSEAAVTAGLRELTRGRSVLVIAHRLSTVVAADTIVVLDRGRVVETGAHEHLMAIDGRYAAFWRARSRAAGWRLVPEDA